MKRKQAPTTSSAATSSRKRVRRAPPPSSPSTPASQHPHGVIDPEKEYKIRDILDERPGQYLIDWEDDEQTGERYEPSWEPRANANQQARADWRRRKREANQQKQQQEQQKPPAKRGRPRKLANQEREAWPPASWVDPATAEAQALGSKPDSRSEALASKQDDEPEIVESQEPALTAPVDESDSPLFVPLVQVSGPSASFEAGGYQKFSSSQSYAREGAEGDEGEEHSRSVPVNFGEGPARVIPDSQTAGEFSSSAPAAVGSEEDRDRSQGQDQATTEPAQSSSGEPLTASADSAQQEQVFAEAPIVQPEESGAFNQAAPIGTLESPLAPPSAAQQRSDQSAEVIATEGERLPRSDLFVGSESKGEPSGESQTAIPGNAEQAELQQAQQDEISLDPSPRHDLHSSGHTVGSEPQLSARIESEHLFAQPPVDQGDEVIASVPLEDSFRREVDSGSHQRTGEENTQDLYSVTPNRFPESSGRLHQPSLSSSRPQRVVDQAVNESSQLPTTTAHPVLRSPFRSLEPSDLSRSPRHVDFTLFDAPFHPTLTSVAHPVSHSSPTAGSSARLHSPFRFTSRPTTQPLARSQAVHSSSPFATVPSRSFGTLGESAPPRPTTPSSPQNSASQRFAQGMEASQGSPDITASSPGPSRQSLSDKLRAIRNKRQLPSSLRQPSASNSPAKSTDAAQPLQPSEVSTISSAGPLTQPPRLVSSVQAEERNNRSPSAVPAMEPLPEISLEEMNTSERYPTLFPQNLEHGTNKEQNDDFPATNGTLSRQSSKMQTTSPKTRSVPIGLTGHQRDHCSSTVRYYQDLIERFLGSPSPDSQLIEEAEALVERLRRITLHPDLDNSETFTQYDVQPETQAQWDVDCSAKFRFLKELFDCLRDQTLHIAILAQPGRIVQVLETFLQGIKVPHRHLHGLASSSLSAEDAGLMVTLVTVDDEVHEIQPSPADLLISMEPTVDQDCLPIKALAQSSESPSLRMTLVVPGSIEHVEQSVSMNLNPHTRLRMLLSGVWQHHKHVGRLEDEQAPVEEAAQSIAEYLSRDEQGEWPIAILEPLANIDSQTESDLEPPASEHAIGANNKRILEAEDGVDGVHKKARFDDFSGAVAPEPSGTINPLDLDITHVSDSIANSTQVPVVGIDGAIQGASALTDTEQRLQRMLKEAQDRLEEHVQALSDLQYRHEEQRDRLVEATSTRDEAIATAERATRRMTESANNVSQLKAERTQLRQQLEEANAKLLSHANPTRVEFETIRLEAEAARTEKAAVEHRLKASQSEADYLKDAYQRSSQSHSSLQTQVADFSNQLTVQLNRAVVEQPRLRQLGYDAQTKNLRNENKKLKMLLRDREQGMRFKDEEIARLKEAGRGRMGTRGNSVPRSPRMGGSAGGGSRQGSPATGDLRGRVAMNLTSGLRNG